jgi:2-methylcitrate dehydratase PrpD
VNTTVDKEIAEDQARITVVLKNGRRLEKFVEHAVGSARNPMTDSQLESKFQGLAEGVLTPDRVRNLMGLCWNIEKSSQAAGIAQAAAA